MKTLEIEGILTKLVDEPKTTSDFTQTKQDGVTGIVNKYYLVEVPENCEDFTKILTPKEINWAIADLLKKNEFLISKYSTCTLDSIINN